MISWATLEDAVRTWVVAATGLAADRVYFSSQDLPISELAPRVSILLGDLVNIGQDSRDHDYDPSRPAGQEIEITAKGMRELVVDLQAFAPLTVGGGTTARSLLSTAQAVLSLPSIRDALNAAGLGVLEQGNVQRIPQPKNATTEDRATLSVRFAVSQSVSERTGYIETVVASYGRGPVLQMDGARDIAGLLSLTRFPRVDQPSFPRIVPGPRAGQSGLQFSRLGATVVSLVARDRGVVSDLRMDRDALARSTRLGFTFSWWLRPEPLTDLGGTTSQTARLFAFGGTDGASVASSAFLGLTWARATNAFLLNTQVPGNVGGTSIAGCASTYTGSALPVGVWAHLACSLKPNGLNLEPHDFGATAEWYLNGTLVFTEIGDGNVALTGPRLPVLDLFPPLRTVGTVGSLWSNTARAFTSPVDASLAELLLYPRPLSATEVATLYATGPFGLRV